MQVLGLKRNLDPRVPQKSTRALDLRHLQKCEPGSTLESSIEMLTPKGSSETTTSNCCDDRVQPDTPLAQSHVESSESH